MIKLLASQDRPQNRRTFSTGPKTGFNFPNFIVTFMIFNKLE